MTCNGIVMFLSNSNAEKYTFYSIKFNKLGWIKNKSIKYAHKKWIEQRP